MRDFNKLILNYSSSTFCFCLLNLSFMLHQWFEIILKGFLFHNMHTLLLTDVRIYVHSLWMMHQLFFISFLLMILTLLYIFRRFWFTTIEDKISFGFQIYQN